MTIADVTATRLEPIDGLSIARVMKHTTLAELDEAVVRTQALIADQQARIRRLDAEGGDSSRQRELLESFRRLLAVQEARRQRFLGRRKHAVAWSPRPAPPEHRREVA